MDPGAYEAFLEAIKQQTLTVPWTDGSLVSLTMLLWGYAISAGVRSANTFPSVDYIGRLLLGSAVLRYLQSYIIYRQGLVEGIWPLFWTVCLIVGVAAARRGARASSSSG